MMRKNKTKLIFNLTAVGLLLLIVILVNFFSQSAEERTLVIAGQKLTVELAQTAAEKASGLSNRPALPAETGMLFVYDRYLIPSFWLKEMRFPIDIIWIKDDMVAGYEKNLAPPATQDNLRYYRPKTFINYVLEVNAGFVDRHQISVGARVELPI